jgi:hypothetical protein
MSAVARYRIPDEPHPSAQEGLIVDPLWPLFAQMLVGSWLALPWFVINGLALGSPTKRREWLLAGASLLGSAAMVWTIALVWSTPAVQSVDPAYGLLGVTVLKLGCAYGLYMVQQRPFELWRHYGGRPKNGLLLVIGAMILARPAVSAALGKSLLAIVLG